MQPVWHCLSVCLSVCATERLQGFYSYPEFDDFSVVGRWYSVITDILAPKTWAPQTGPKTQNDDFWEKAKTIFITFKQL
jgi:hypothetical protein